MYITEGWSRQEKRYGYIESRKSYVFMFDDYTEFLAIVFIAISYRGTIDRVP
jgi:hypothetical protein